MLMEERRTHTECGPLLRRDARGIRVPLTSEADVVVARLKGRELATRLGFPSTEAILIVAAIEELARNILRYATHGEMLLKDVTVGWRRGIAVIAYDEGPGIANVELALQDGFSTSNGLGLGLPGVKRLMDELQIVSEPNQGTTVLAKKWVTDRQGGALGVRDGECAEERLLRGSWAPASVARRWR